MNCDQQEYNYVHNGGKNQEETTLKNILLPEI